MTNRRSERPPAGRLGKSTPGRGTRRFASEAPKHTAEVPRKRSFDATWPLFGDSPPPFPVDPTAAVHGLSPPSADLKALAAAASEATPGASRQRATTKIKDSLPATAPEWVHAAHALASWLHERVARGSIDPTDQAAVARAWAAFCLGGVTESQIMRVAHVVQRAHKAIRETPRSKDQQGAFHAAAGVLHAALPTAIRQRMPLERAVFVVRRLYDEADAWAAIVEGTTELLGWTDYARLHAASAIRAALERSRPP